MAKTCGSFNIHKGMNNNKMEGQNTNYNCVSWRVRRNLNLNKFERKQSSDWLDDGVLTRMHRHGPAYKPKCILQKIYLVTPNDQSYHLLHIYNITRVTIYPRVHRCIRVSINILAARWNDRSIQQISSNLEFFSWYKRNVPTCLQRSHLMNIQTVNDRFDKI